MCCQRFRSLRYQERVESIVCVALAIGLFGACDSSCRGEAPSDAPSARDADPASTETDVQIETRRATQPWARSFGGARDDEAFGVTVSEAGEIIVVGAFRGRLGLGDATEAPRSRGQSDIFVAAFAPTGELLWLRTIGGAGQDQARAVVATGDGYWVTGAFEGEVAFSERRSDRRVSNGRRDVFLLRLESDGRTRIVGSFGGTGDDQGLTVAAGPNGSAFIAGEFTGSLDVVPGNVASRRVAIGDTNAFILRVDGEGRSIWSRSLSGEGPNVARAVAGSADGGVLVAGDFAGSVDLDPGSGSDTHRSRGLTDMFAARLDSEGELVWSWVGGGEMLDQLNGAAFERSGEIWLAGLFMGDVEVELDGEVTRLEAQGRSDGLVLRLSPEGRPRAAHVVGGESADFLYDVSARPGGGVVVAGRFSGTLDPDDEVLGDELEAGGRAAALLLEFDPAGALRNLSSLGGAGLDRWNAVTGFGDEAIILAGAFEGELTSTEWSPPLVSRGATDGLIVFRPPLQ